MMRMIEPASLSRRYRVADAAQADFGEVYRLFCSEKHYFEYFSLPMSEEQLRRDMTLLPDGCTEDQKYFLAYYDGGTMIALLDLIDGYPTDRTCYIGLFMVDADHARRGIGTAIITELCAALDALGYEALRLAYGKDYRQAVHFWTKNGFIPQREAELEEYGALIVAERALC